VQTRLRRKGCSKRKLLSLVWNHEFSTNCASWCTSFTPTSDLPTWPRWSNSLQHLRHGLASGLPVTCCTGSQRWKPSSVSEPSVMPALLPGTVCQTILNLSQTLNISRNFSKLTCLHCNFNSYIFFIVCRNMKCPPVYLSVDNKPRWWWWCSFYARFEIFCDSCLEQSPRRYSSFC